MGRHTKWNNVVKLVEIIKFSGLVAVMAIKDKEPISASYIRLSMLLKVI
jgi:hypothetical protein